MSTLFFLWTQRDKPWPRRSQRTDDGDNVGLAGSAIAAVAAAVRGGGSTRRSRCRDRNRARADRRGLEDPPLGSKPAERLELELPVLLSEGRTPPASPRSRLAPSAEEEEAGRTYYLCT